MNGYFRCRINLLTPSSHPLVAAGLIVIFISLLPVVFGIRCWVCRSDSDPKCADPFDNRTLPITDCDIVTLPHLKNEPIFPNGPIRPMKATMCRKIRQKIYGQWRTIRGCAFIGKPGEGTGNEHHCLIRQGTYDVYMEYCTCNSKDGCNTGVSTLPTGLWIASSLVISPLLMIFASL